MASVLFQQHQEYWSKKKKTVPRFAECSFLLRNKEAFKKSLLLNNLMLFFSNVEKAYNKGFIRDLNQ